MSVDRHDARELKQLQSLPLEYKIEMTKERIRVWYESWTKFEIIDDKTGKTRYVTMDTRQGYVEPPMKETEWNRYAWDGQVYVSFSGGKDSTVLKHIVDSMYDDVPAVFVNTGLEYPEIQKFVKEIKAGKYSCFNPDVEILRPEMRFDEVIKNYGYPVIGKRQAEAIELARKNLQQNKYSVRLRYLGITAEEAQLMGLELPSEEMLERYEKTVEGSKYSISKYRYLLNADFPISSKCCDVMKKKPAFKYQKETGRKPIVGTMAFETINRESSWIRNGCNSFNGKHPLSQPMSFWTEQDVYLYIKKYNVPYAPVYGDIVTDTAPEFDEQINMIDYLGDYEPGDKLKTTGCNRTGCIFCAFGCQNEKEPNRFQRLKETHPRQYDYCINGGEMVDGKWQPSKEGLGLGKVLDYIGVKY